MAEKTNEIHTKEFLQFTSCGLKGQNPFNRANQRLEILIGSITVQFIDRQQHLTRPFKQQRQLTA